MVKETQQNKLTANWNRYCEERDRMKAEGKAIGTFSAWQFKLQLVDIKIPTSRQDFNRQD